MKVQGCVVPTSVFSNHTGFPSFFCDDYTDRMPAYIEEWKKLGLRFEGITSGFLGSAAQIEIVTDFIRAFRDERTKVVIDPVMGENGRAYPTYTADMCERMKHLVQFADILTPNVTEACMLAGLPYKGSGWTGGELRRIIERLRGLGAGKIVISGLETGHYVSNAVSERPGERSCARNGSAKCARARAIFFPPSSRQTVSTAWILNSRSKRRRPL